MSVCIVEILAAVNNAHGCAAVERDNDPAIFDHGLLYNSLCAIRIDYDRDIAGAGLIRRNACLNAGQRTNIFIVCLNGDFNIIVGLLDRNAYGIFTLASKFSYRAVRYNNSCKRSLNVEIGVCLVRQILRGAARDRCSNTRCICRSTDLNVNAFAIVLHCVVNQIICGGLVNVSVSLAVGLFCCNAYGCTFYGRLCYGAYIAAAAARAAIVAAADVAVGVVAAAAL